MKSHTEILLEAADLIEEKGLGQATAGMRVDGPYCVAGAVCKAAGGKTWDAGPLRGISFIGEDAEAILGVPYHMICNFSDGLEYAPKNIFWWKRNKAKKAAKLLRLMAKGHDFHTARRMVVGRSPAKS